MKYAFKSRTLVCITALMTAPAAFADVTAQEVWDVWKDQMTAGGYGNQISIGAETMSGDTLTIASITADFDDGDASVFFEFGPISFTENGDGTVSIDTPDTYQIFIGDSGNTDMNRVTLEMSSTGQSLLVSGTPDNFNYDLSVDRYTLSIADALDGGEPMPIEASFNLNGVSGSYIVQPGEMMNTVYDIAVSSADYLFSFEDGSDAGDVAGQFADMTIAADISAPMDIDEEHPEMMFQQGASFDVSLTNGPSSQIAALTDYSGTMNIASANQGVSFAFALDKSGMSVSETVNDVTIQASGGQVPFPIELTASTIGFGMDMPLEKTDEPAPFSALINIDQLGLDDMIWMMGDPTGALPHDPITLQIALSGTGKLFFDVLDPEQSQAMEMAEVPGELHSLKLDNLNVSLAGASVVGDGSFTFDNSDLATFGGMPRPEGSATLVGNGINGLIDKLETMGLPMSDQLMGARMMLGMFAKTTGDDQLETTLEVNGDGHVMLNGQRIQ